MFDERLTEKADNLLDLCRKQGVRIVTAESCTGGLISALLTEIAGSSDVFERGFVTYSNDAKMEQLGVSKQALTSHGAVSKETARLMAEGALKNAKADISIAVTGIAGPGGGSDHKPVGLVYIALACADHRADVYEYLFGDIGRQEIRFKTVASAIDLALEHLRQSR